MQAASKQKKNPRPSTDNGVHLIGRVGRIYENTDKKTLGSNGNENTKICYHGIRLIFDAKMSSISDLTKGEMQKHSSKSICISSN